MFANQVESFTEDYIREYGERHFRKIYKKVENSRSVNNYLIKLQEINFAPYHKDLIVTIMNMPYFMVAKRETVAMASILLLLKWDKMLNRNNKLADDNDLEMILKDILRGVRDI